MTAALPLPDRHIAIVKLGLRSRILLAFGLATLVLGLVGAESWRSAGATIALLEVTTESDRELSLLDDLARAMTDADRAVRDFAYSQRPRQLVDFDSARTRIRADLAMLRPLMADEPGSARSLADLDRVMTARLAQTTELTSTARHVRSAIAGSIAVTLLVIILGAISIVREVDARAAAQRQAAAASALLHDTHDELRDLYDNAPSGYHSVDADGLIVRMNDTGLAWLGYTREEVVGRMHITDLITPEAAAGFQERVIQFLSVGSINHVECEFIRKDGSRAPMLMSATPVHDAAGRFVMTRTVVTDITDQRRTRDELEAAVYELGEALASVKTLSGLLPICSMCKKIRDDQGYWKGVETYVSAHTDAEFSHGVCPECFPRMFPDVAYEEAAAAVAARPRKGRPSEGATG